MLYMVKNLFLPTPENSNLLFRVTAFDDDLNRLYISLLTINTFRPSHLLANPGTEAPQCTIFGGEKEGAYMSEGDMCLNLTCW